MLGTLFNTLIHQPIYNALAAIVGVVPGGDLGIAIILLTTLIKLILLPLSLAAIRTQVAMRELDPELKKLKVDLKDNQEELARRTMALFKEKKVNPLASIILIFIQLPVIIGLYGVFLSEGKGAGFDPSLLYSFIPFPEHASVLFLGLVDLTGRSVVLAVLVGVAQFVYARIMTMPKPGAEQSFSNDLARSMQLQMKYVFPIVMIGIAYAVSAGAALYLLVSNLFAIAQELVIKKSRIRETAAAGVTTVK